MLPCKQDVNDCLLASDYSTTLPLGADWQPLKAEQRAEVHMLCAAESSNDTISIVKGAQGVKRAAAAHCPGSHPQRSLAAMGGPSA